MAEAGILSREGPGRADRWGDCRYGPDRQRGCGTTDCLTSLVARIVADGKVQVRVQGSLRLDRHNEPQPDLMLLRPRGDLYRASHPTAADVLLLVEVADSSLAYDRGPKSPVRPPPRARGVDRRSGRPHS